MGWLSSLFQGGNMEIEYVDEQGRKQTKRVSKRQFEARMSEAVADGKATVHDACQVHILNPMTGKRVENWIIGQQVNRESYDNFKDRDGNLYAAIHYKKGEPNLILVQKPIWEQFARQFSDIDR